MTMISYAQNREDVLLARLFPSGTAGTYIDVGASDPVVNSLTKHFYDRGWSGINVEPAARPFLRLQAERRRDINLNVGVSDRVGQLTFFEFGPQASGVSTFSEPHALHHEEIGHSFAPREVTVTTLASICAEHATGPIDFMSIDVEGHEREVIAGADFTRWRPRVIVVEATEPATSVPTHELWEPALLEAGYRFGCFDGLNRYYVRGEDAALLPALSTPVNIFDDYVPHELAVCQGQLAAARAVGDSLRAQYGSIFPELGALQAQYQQLERTLGEVRDELDAVESRVEQTSGLCRSTLEELRPYEQLISDWHGLGPRSLRIAHLVRESAERFPAAAGAARRGAGLARKLSSRVRSAS